jgi:hypothetical protein
MRSLLSVSVAAVLGACFHCSDTLLARGEGPGSAIVGTVTLTAADGRTFAGEGARVTLACLTEGTTRTEVSDEHGAFRFPNVPVDSCSIQADVQGFVAQPVSVVTAADQVSSTVLHLGVAALRVGVNVGGTAPVREPKMRWTSRRSAAGRPLERSADRCAR